MNRGMRQFWQPRYTKFIGFSVFSVGLALLPSHHTFANEVVDTPGVKVVSGGEQRIARDTLSSAIVVQFRGADSEPVEMPVGAKIAATTNSETGEFYIDSETKLAGEYEVVTAASSVTLYYKDTTAGDYELSFAMQNEDGAAQAKMSYIISVKSSIASIDRPSQPHISDKPLQINGMLQYVPAGTDVVVIVKNTKGAEIWKAGVTARGDNVLLATLEAGRLKQGSYTIQLVGTRDNKNEFSSPTVPLEVKAPSPEVKPTPPQTPNPEQKKDEVTITTNQSIEPIEPITRLSLSSSFSRPITATSSSARNFISATSRPSSLAVSARSSSGKDDDDMQKSEIQGVKDSEQSITLQTSSDDRVAVEASEEGWRFFGAPWYWWGGGTVALYGAWFGARRLIGGSE